MLTTEFGTATDIKFVELLTTSTKIVEIEWEITTLTNPLHPSNAPDPIEATKFSIETELITLFLIF